MGLQKNITNIFDGNDMQAYFRLNDTQLNYTDQTASATFFGYASKKAFNNGRPAMASVTLTLSSGTVPSFNDVLSSVSMSASGIPATPVDAMKTAFYNFSKQTPDFDGASDA